MKRELFRHENRRVAISTANSRDLSSPDTFKHFRETIRRRILPRIMPKLHNNESLGRFWHFSRSKKGKSAPPMQLLPPVNERIGSAQG
jgi:hypothetical protein